MNYCKYFHIDCGEHQCWAIKETDGKVLPCAFEGDLDRCIEAIIREQTGEAGHVEKMMEARKCLM